MVAIGAWVACVALIVFNLLNHGLWLDETHAWCIVRDSTSFSDFRWNMRNEGHPWLWHAMLWPLAKSGAPVWSMQVLHGLIAAATCTVVLLRSPFSLSVRVLLVFGYFLLFEYAALSRNYAVGNLLLLLVADLVRQQRKGAAFVLLLILPQVHLWAACLVASWAILDMLKPQLFPRWKNMLLVLSSALALWCVLPTDPLPYSPDPARLLNIDTYRSTAIQLTKAFVPIPNVDAVHVWNSSILADADHALAIWTGPLLLVALIVLLPLDRWGRTRFIIGSLAVLVLPLLAPFLSQRYVGPLLAIAVACLWAWPSTGKPTPWPVKALVAVVLILQVAGGLAMSYITWQRPFSLSREAARVIEPEAGPILLMRYDAAPSISAYLGAPVYLVFRHDMGSYCRWNDPRSIATMDDLSIALRDLAPLNAQVVSEGELDHLIVNAAGYGIRASTPFTGSLLRHEDHVVTTLVRLNELRSPL